MTAKYWICETGQFREGHTVGGFPGFRATGGAWTLLYNGAVARLA